jgi:gamma-glutamyltranspeptidase/glutathione hydrolase
MMKRLSLILVLILSLAACAHSSGKPKQHAVASAHPAATQAGIATLNQGGNAFDAAVAVSAALAVVEPFGSGLGGGGFWLLHDAKNNNNIMLDGREVAPLAAHRDMYLNEAGEPIKYASVNGALAAGIPGLPAALVHLSTKYGKLPLSISLQPAIRLAEEGFVVNEHFRRLAKFRQAVLSQSEAAEAIFLVNGKAPDIGAVIYQANLANTLRLLANNGFDGFYKGKVATLLVDGVQKSGGIWTLQDLAEYKVKEREPVSIDYNGMKIISAALPSSGGLVLSIALNILEQYDLASMDDETRTHVIVEAMRRAYRERALYMGDSDFIDVPVAKLSNKKHAYNLAKNLSLQQATPSSQLTGLNEIEGHDTTHFSILDKAGNRVAATLSVNYPFGSGFVPPGTGVLLNDEMDDFSIKPGTPNVYGLVGGEANSIQPGKRMLSSMSPTFIEMKNSVGILGTPGGSRIISMVLLGILDAEQGHKPMSWVDLPRYHHQYLPDQIQYEPNAFNADEQAKLKQKGHKMKVMNRQYGNMHAILWEKSRNEVTAASDKRGSGSAVVESVR